MDSTEVISIVIAISFGIFSIVGVMLSLFLWALRKEIDSIYKKFNELDSKGK